MTGSEDLCDRLRALLVDEELRPGDRLGDERGLADRFAVTRARLRTALAQLEAEGVVRRRIGRAGGVVMADHRLERNLDTVESLADITRRQGVDLRTVVLHAVIAPAGPRERRALRLPPGAPVHRIVRLRVADGTPLSIEDSRLPALTFPGLADHDLGSLYRTLADVYGAAPTRAEESLEVTVARQEQAERLDVPVGTPLLHVQRVATAAGRPVELAEEFFVAHRVRVHARQYGYVRVDRRRPARCNGPPGGTSVRALTGTG